MSSEPSRAVRLGQRRLGRLFGFVVAAGWAFAPAVDAWGQTPAAPAAALSGMDDVMRELRELRQEVREARQLKQQLIQLQNEVATLKGASPTANVVPRAAGVGPGQGIDTPRAAGDGPTSPALPDPMLPSGVGYVTGMGRGGSETDTSSLVGSTSGPVGGLGSTYRSGAPAPSQTPTGPDDKFPLTATYKYSYNATGPLGGGGYTRVATPDDEFTLNLTNQLTVDGTFFDRQHMPTTEQGFNVPFARTFLYGNITRNWIYQVGTQGFLGSFNLLDVWMGYRFGDWLTIRAGKGLTPPLYEYIAFTPALEPVITNSPLFQMAAGRPIGVMFLGNIFGNRLQYWSGVTNTAKSTYYALDRNAEFNGQVDFTPFKGETWNDSVLSGLGGGVGFSAGDQQYALNQGNSIGFSNNGEASTNSAWVTSSGVPFAVYNSNVKATGMRTRVAPHIYWYGRFSVLAEYMDYSRELTDGATTGRSTQRGYYINTSYFLTGERDFRGNGFQGYSTVVPNSPFLPSKGLYGPGAWQVAAQWSGLDVGRGDFERGFIDSSRYTNRLGQLMVGLNWWPNKYTRLSFDYVWTDFNNAIPINGPNPVRTFNTFWMRFAMYF